MGVNVKLIGHLYHEPDIQKWLLEHGSRDEIIDWLVWNDGNGVYTDDDSIAEGYEPLTLETARAAMRKVLRENQ